MHLVGVIIRIRHGARSRERKKKRELGVVRPVVFQRSTVLGNYITVCIN